MRLEGRFRSAAISLLCMLATACAGPVTLVDSPSVRLTRIEMGHMRFDGQTVVLGFDISNPNSFPLPVRAVSYRVDCAGHRFASGETQGEFTVPAEGDSSFAISVDLDMLQQTSRIAALLRAGSSGDLPYELDGTLTVNIPFTGPIPFSTTGTISLTPGH